MFVFDDLSGKLVTRTGGMMGNAKRRLSLWRWPVLVLLAQAATAAAAGNQFLDMTLEELVDYRLMSMSRKEQRVADMAAAAYVISAEEIRRSGAQSIPEALRLVPGLNVAQISPGHWAVSSRGFNDRFANKLLVQLDGRSVYSPMFAGVMWESMDNLMPEIERIEVIRGPGAALWGVNAMNGVINIVTRSASASQGGQVSAGMGSDGEMSVSMRMGETLSQGGHYKIYGQAKGQGGAGASDGAFGVTRRQRMGMKWEPQLDGQQLEVKAEIYQGRENDVWVSPTVRAYSDPNTPYSSEQVLREHAQGGSVQVRHAWKTMQGADNVLQASVDRDQVYLTGVWGSGTDPTTPTGHAPSRTVFGGIKHDLDVDFQQRRMGDVHDVIWGLNLRYTREELSLPVLPYLLADGHHERLNYSAFVHDEIELEPDRFKWIWGSKFEKDGLTGFNVQPNLRFLFTPASHETYWGALSRSVRPMRRVEGLASVNIAAADAATLNAQTGLNLPAGALTVMSQMSPLANAKLGAEDAVSLEAGWRRQFSSTFSADTALFLTRYSHLRGGLWREQPITGVPQALECLTKANQAPGVCYFTLSGYNANQNKARAWGGEFSLDWLAQPWWRLRAAYSHLRVKGERTNDSLSKMQVDYFETSAPRHQVLFNNNFSLAHDLNLDVRLRRNSSTAHYLINSWALTPVPAYTGLDMRLGWQVQKQTEISVLGRNLLKNRHVEFINIMPSTVVYEVHRSLLIQAVMRY